MKDLYPGHLFGEVALLYKTKRTASIKSKDHCLVGALSEENFIEMCSQFSYIENDLKIETTYYKDKWKELQIKLLSTVDYF